MPLVVAQIGQTPPDHKGYDMPTDEISANADTYDEGREELLKQVPEGWRVLSWRTHG